ncbi:MAG: serine O-acetyltransferase, partial [Spirochaetota bacterium]
RHPTLGNNVVVGAGAIVLGAIDVGDGARIGAGSVVIHDVPPGATVVGVPGRVGMGFFAKEIEMLEHGKLPDPLADLIRYMLRQQSKLDERLKQVETLEGLSGSTENYEDKTEAEIVKKVLAFSEAFTHGGGI